MRAASSSSLGRPRMNCTIRKMKNASCARNFGTTSGRFVLIQSSWENKTYWGTISTWMGSISVASIMAKKTFLPRKFSRAKA